MREKDSASWPHVVIVGGGFGGLHAARGLGDRPVRVTLVDKRNYHLFQPLLYQVATGGLSPGDISAPLRAVLKRFGNISVIAAEVVDIDTAQRRLVLGDGELSYDILILATGASHHYFGNEEWQADAPGLKTVEDALEIRRRVLLAFEAAEREPDPRVQQEWLTFAVVGGGPTGVELAGAVAELAHRTLRGEFRHIDPAQARILLLEGMERLLPPYPEKLSAKAQRALERLGVEVRTGTMVTAIDDHTVRFERDGSEEDVAARTVLWGAGMKASSLGQILERETGTELDRSGRVLVEPDLTVPGHPEIRVIGDLAGFVHQGDQPLPGVAPVAMQQGQYVARSIVMRLRGKEPPAFRYRDKGNLAVIGRNAAVADLGLLQFNGFPAWVAWIVVHLAYLVEFENKLLVLLQWAWSYFTRKRGARLITGKQLRPWSGASRGRARRRRP